MKKILTIIIFALIFCNFANAQMLDFEFLARMINMPEDSVSSIMQERGWLYEGKRDLMMGYIKGDDSYYESLGFNIHYGRVVLIVYQIPETSVDNFKKGIKYSEHLDSLDIDGKYFDGYKTFSYGKDLMFAIANELEYGLITILVEAMHQTEFYTLDQCADLFAQGKYAEITPSLWHIKEVSENMLVINQETYIYTLLFLSIIYDNYYNDPEQSAKILLEGYNKLLDKGYDNTEFTRNIVVRLGEKYRSMQQLPSAEFYYKKAEEMYKDAGDFSEGYVRLLSHLTLLYYDFGNDEKMTEYNQRVIEEYSKKNGDIYKATDYSGLSLLLTVSLINSETGRIDEAEKGYNHIISSISKDTQFDISTYNFACHNLAVIKMQQQKFQEAMALLNKIIDLPSVSTDDFILDQLTCCLFLDDKQNTIKYLRKFCGYMQQKYTKMFFKRTQENFGYAWFAATKPIEFLNFVALKSDIGEAAKTAYENALYFKTLSLESNIIVDDFVRNSVDDNIKRIYDEYKKLKQQSIFKTDDYDEKISRLLKCEDLYDSLMSKIVGLNYVLKSQILDFAGIKKNLDDGEYAVEFCKIPIYEKLPVQTDYYGAYIFCNKSEHPKIISLCKIEDFDKKFIIPNADRLTNNELYNASNLIYKMLLKKIDDIIPDAKNVYYAPYGNLALLNFDCIKDNDGTLLNEKYQMVRVSSTANIKKIKKNKDRYSTAIVLYGDINYNASLDEMKTESKNFDIFSGEDISAIISERGTNANVFSELKGSKSEIYNISDIAEKGKMRSFIFRQNEANEESFKGLSGLSPEILHLATHGFCFDTGEKAADKPFAKSVNTYSQKESAMVLSGLALSGANNVWKGNFDLPNVEDGILTAYEISQLDLSNTKLVVLSACETARGRIFPVDGVFGLQRAFKQAGAGSVLMSLWKVDDNATAIFMEHFYRFLFETSDRHKALQMAQNEVKKQFPDPYYWAAWVMLD